MSSVSPLARSTPITDNLAVTQTLEVTPTGSDATTHQQRAAGTELTQEPSTRLGKVCVGFFFSEFSLSLTVPRMVAQMPSGSGSFTSLNSRPYSGTSSSVRRSQGAKAVCGVVHSEPRVVLKMITWTDLIAAIVSRPEFAHISQSTVQGIVKKVGLSSF
jgi:hypothetical protein